MEGKAEKPKKVNVVCDKRLDKYFGITGRALEKVKEGEKDDSRAKEAADFLDMAERYFSDANHFRKEGNYVLALAAVNYAHAWLDAGARIGLFKVKDTELFAAD
ncbi:MAG TPA: DUF357 domain-containing protein [Candidatus Nanoarchaeia archaeon]|nr:DUF357 domain-containing protein [Candidatus Nanoarchaeia archaeon]